MRLLKVALLGPLAVGVAHAQDTVDCDVYGTDVVTLMTQDNPFLQIMGALELATTGDVKPFVDRTLRDLPRQVCDAFNLVDTSDQTALLAYRAEYFYDANETLTSLEPGDAVPPADLPLHAEQTASNQEMVERIVDLWTLLYRQVDTTVWADERSTLDAMPEPLVVPGGRFVEAYYWDTYWIVRGLLHSQMFQTVKGMLANFLEKFDTIGFIPNGFRKYYNDRSQPPYIGEMMRAYYEFTEDTQFIEDNWEKLLVEYEHFCNGCNETFVEPSDPRWVDAPGGLRYIEDGYVVHVQTPAGSVGRLNRYYQDNDQPRVESVTQDIETMALANTDFERTPEMVARNLRAAAESGWDFSARWFVPVFAGEWKLEDIMTMEYLPVDLNTLLFRMEVNIANFALIAQGSAGMPTFETYMERAAQRKGIMKDLLYDMGSGRWADLHFPSNSLGRVEIAASFYPAWSGMLDEAETVAALDYLIANGTGLIGECGLATSTTESGQQWDYPNVWAPLIHTAVEALMGPNHLTEWARPLNMSWIGVDNNYMPYTGAFGPPPKFVFDDENHYHNTAFHLVEGFVTSMANGFVPGQTEGYFEKYSVVKVQNEGVDPFPRCGYPGTGGEYETPTGFGWTNGAALEFLYHFGPQFFPRDDENDGAFNVAVPSLGFIFAISALSWIL